MSRLRRSTFLIVFCLALLVSACGGATSPASAPTSGAASADATSQPATAPDDGADDSLTGQPDGYESPVAELFGIPVSDPDALSDQTTQLQAEAERQTAECMRAQGFEYQPVDYSRLGELGSAIAVEGKKFAEDYGFGIATSIGGTFEEVDDLFKDPNQDYVSALSEGEQEAYYNALVGGSLTIDSFDETQEFEPAGCSGEAYETAFGSFAKLDAFDGELSAMDEQIQSDHRVVEANASWAACMFDRGYGYTNVDGARADIERRYDELVRNDTGAGFPAGPAEAVGDGEEDGAVMIMGGPIFSPETQAKVDELAVEERSVALASWECEQPIRKLLDEVRIEYELRFVEQHGEAVRAAVGG